ncbi:hypothetical protein NDU88_003427 [Pleurodeles waltl]|uniref:Uncharacterized protein n=1 Tax=Pleurodeles waltl TaxID=8319 RepID=A0AAV7SGA1_PLEWA|nr:hypothetical protein NDU88_003427 [Pleurodeles waltl]
MAWHNECSRVLEHPATIDGGSQAAGYRGGTAGDDLEGEGDGNPDIRIPLTINDRLPQQRLARTEKNA